MSRIGKKPIAIPAGVTVTVADGAVSIKGPKGEDRLVLHPHARVAQNAGELAVSVEKPEEKFDRSLWGLHRALLAAMIEGVTQGFSKKLEMVGVGYKAVLQGKNLVLEAGFSHPVELAIPEGITVAVEKNTLITISGINKQKVGTFAAQARAVRKPEPYKGKGIKYIGEVIRRKEGKAAKAAGAK